MLSISIFCGNRLVETKLTIQMISLILWQYNPVAHLNTYMTLFQNQCNALSNQLRTSYIVERNLKNILGILWMSGVAE